DAAQGKAGPGQRPHDEAVADEAGAGAAGKGGAHRFELSPGVGADIEHGGEAEGAVEQRQAVALLGFGGEGGGFGVDEAAVAADAPGVAEAGAAGAFAHGLAAEQHRLDGAQAGVGREVDLEPAVEPRVFEENGFLRQPVEPGAGAGGEAGGDAGIGAGRAVDALAGLGGEYHPGAGRGGGAPAALGATGGPKRRREAAG